MITILAKSNMAHQVEHANAMAMGLNKHNQMVCIQEPGGHLSGMVICWGWAVGEFYRDLGCEVLVMERGYIGDRQKYTSLGWNGLNGRARFPSYFDGTRFIDFENLYKPFKTAGSYAIIMGQVSGDMSLKGVNIWDWYKNTASQLMALGMPVMFRPHPVSVQYGESTKIDGATTMFCALQDALAQAAVVVTYNSNSGVDSMLAGKPTIAIDKGSMAFPICEHDLIIQKAEPTFRREWLERISWCQWTLQEISNGTAWEHVKEVKKLQ